MDVLQGKKLYAEMQAQVQAKNALNEAMVSRDVPAIAAAIDKCKSLGVEDLAEAEGLLAKLQEEEAIRAGKQRGGEEQW